MASWFTSTQQLSIGFFKNQTTIHIRKFLLSLKFLNKDVEIRN